MDAVVDLLKQQKPLLKKYWSLASDAVDLFRNGDASIGAAWPYMTNTLRESGAPVAETIPQEGATGWADSWMISAHAPHPNCAYEWINFVTTPRVQAQQALSFGETPANTQACAEMNKITPGSCTALPRRRAGGVFQAHQLLENPGARLRQWRDKLPGLQRLAAGLAIDQGLTRIGSQKQARSSGAARTSTTAATLSLPAIWFIVFYLAALVLLFVSAFWQVDSMTGEIQHTGRWIISAS